MIAFGWFWIIAGSAIAIVTLGLGFVVYAPIMALGCLFIIAGRSGQPRRVRRYGRRRR